MAVLNIKDLLNPVKKEESAPVSLGETLKEPYTQEQLQAKWQIFTEQLKAEGKQNDYLALNRTWTLTGDTMHLVLDNDLQEDILNILKPDLLEYLRKGLRNQLIQITAEVKQLETGKRIYTVQDKLNHLSEKHPVIHELRKRFGLDTDY